MVKEVRCREVRLVWDESGQRSGDKGKSGLVLIVYSELSRIGRRIEESAKCLGMPHSDARKYGKGDRGIVDGCENRPSIAQKGRQLREDERDNGEARHPGYADASSKYLSHNEQRNSGGDHEEKESSDGKPKETRNNGTSAQRSSTLYRSLRRCATEGSTSSQDANTKHHE